MRWPRRANKQPQVAPVVLPAAPPSPEDQQIVAAFSTLSTATFTRWSTSEWLSTATMVGTTMVGRQDVTEWPPVQAPVRPQSKADTLATLESTLQEPPILRPTRYFE